MKEKKYKSITEVSNLLKINTHVIRYWDSKFTGLSTRLSKSKHRFFNNDNIKRLYEIKNILYDQDGKHNYSLDLVNKLSSNKSRVLSNKEKPDVIAMNQSYNHELINELRKISQNLKKILNSI